MTCTTLTINGETNIICTRGRAGALCRNCGAPATRLCDWCITERKTCDKPLCRRCAFLVAENTDLCPQHRALSRERCILPS